jgi:hypothetical protein
MQRFRMTRRFFQRIAALCTRLPIAVVAQMAKLSSATVAKVDGRAIDLGLGAGSPTSRRRTFSITLRIGS